MARRVEQLDVVVPKADRTRADDCFGVELGCNDDFNGPQSQLQLSLSSGQTVWLFVDSYGMGGNYTLNISGP